MTNEGRQLTKTITVAMVTYITERLTRPAPPPVGFVPDPKPQTFAEYVKARWQA